MNPRREGNEHVKVVTLRSGKELAIQGQPPMIREVEIEEVIQTSQNDNIEKEQPQEKYFGEKKLRQRTTNP